MDYHPVVIAKRPRSLAAKHSAESREWRQYRHPVFVKEYAPVTSIHFSPSKPHRYAVTAATRVQIYAPRTQKVTKTISRFKDVARSGSIRGDGKLVVAGDDTGLVQVFDVNSRAILRTLDAHKQPVHVTSFSSLDHTRVFSCSDDTTVRLWDVPSQSCITTFASHSDYVRTGHFSSSDPNLIITGSYDATVRLFDIRTGQCEMVMGGPSAEGCGQGATAVEQVLLFPSATVALSSAGPILRVWDLVAGGRCVRALSNHQKTVTAMTFNSDASRVLTGGLDQMVKVYDVSTYKVVHTMRYPAPIICLAVSPDETHIAAGMTDGTLSVRRRQPKAPGSGAADMVPTLESLLGGSFATIGQGRIKEKLSKPVGDVDEMRVESKRKKRLRDYDKMLKNFKYTAALDAVLRKRIPPTTVFALIQELVHRDGLRTALAGRDDVLLEPVLILLLKYVNDPRFGEIVCDIARVVIDMYSSVLGQSPFIDTLLVRLAKKVQVELRFQRELLMTKGALEMLLATSTLSGAS